MFTFWPFIALIVTGVMVTILLLLKFSDKICRARMTSDSKQGGGYADQYPVDQNQVKYINDETEEGESKIILKVSSDYKNATIYMFFPLMESFIIRRFFNLEKSNVVFEVTVIYKKNKQMSKLVQW